VSKVLRISEKVLRDLANEDLENQVISVFLEKVEGDKDRFRFEDTSGQVLIQSGLEFGAERAENLRRRIGKWFPKTRAVQFEVADELGLGLQLIVGDTKVAWHLADYLKDLEKGILEDLPTARRELP
jgi:F-type H+-transporting ATPase subunit b